MMTHFEDRKYGESKLNLREQWLYLMHLFRLYGFCYPEVFRFATFGAVGASGLLVDVAVFSALFPIIGMAAGRAIAIWIAMTWNFQLNRRLTFKEPAESNPVSEYVRFCVACLLGAGISWSTSMGLIYILESFRAHPVGAVIVGTGIAAVVNYAICRLWVFGKRRNGLRSGTSDEAQHLDTMLTVETGESLNIQDSHARRFSDDNVGQRKQAG